MKTWIITLQRDNGGQRKAVFTRKLNWIQRMLLEMAGFDIEEQR